MTENRETDTIDISHEVLVALRQIIQTIDLYSRHLVRECGLTGPQLVSLQEIHTAGEVAVGDLARSVSLSQATITGILDRLEKQELILRRRDTVDRRRVMVRIEPAGEALLRDAPPPMQASFMTAFQKLEDWEQTMILSALQRLVVLMGARQIKAAPVLAADPLFSADSDECNSPGR